MTITRKLLAARKEVVLKPKNKIESASIYDILDISNKSRNTLQLLKDIAAKELIVTRQEIAGVKCVKFQPNFKLKYFSNTPHHPEILMIYIHGGGFVGGFIEQGTYFIKAVERRIGCTCLAIDYDLSPEVLFPHALNQILNVYTEIIKWHKPNKIILAGESAGGNLGTALLLKLKELNLPMPKMFVNASGFMDLTCSGESHKNNENTDYSLSLKQLNYMAKAYVVGDDKHNNEYKHLLQNPYVSPVYADVTGFPPTFFSVCTDELLYSDTITVVNNYKKAKVKHKLTTNQKCFHAYLIMGDFFEESKINSNELAMFIKTIFRLKEINLIETNNKK